MILKQRVVRDISSLALNWFAPVPLVCTGMYNLTTPTAEVQRMDEGFVPCDPQTHVSAVGIHI